MIWWVYLLAVVVLWPFTAMVCLPSFLEEGWRWTKRFLIVTTAMVAWGAAIIAVIDHIAPWGG